MPIEFSLLSVCLMQLHIFLASLLLAGPACAQGVADLSGDVDNATTDSVAVSWRAQPFDSRERTVAVHLDKHGRFQLRVPLASPATARLIHGGTDMPLFLEPGNALRLRFRADKFAESLTFRADGETSKSAAAANNYLVDFENQFADNEGFQVLPENIQLYEKPFLSFLDYRRTQQRALLHSHAARFTPAFAAYAQAEIEYAYANDRLTYATLREQVVAGEAGPALSPNYYDFLHDPAVVPGTTATPLSAECQDFMLNYLHHEVEATGLTPTAPGYYPACYQVARQQLGGPMRLAVLSQVLAETFRFGSAAHAPVLLADFATLAPPAWTAALGQDWAAHSSRAVGGARAAPAPAHCPRRHPAPGQLRGAHGLCHVLGQSPGPESARNALPQGSNGHLRRAARHVRHRCPRPRFDCLDPQRGGLACCRHPRLGARPPAGRRAGRLWHRATARLRAVR